MSEAPQISLPGVEGHLGDESSDSCFTPKWIIDGVVDVMGAIDTDPFWHPDCHVRPLEAAYDGRERGDGLVRDWFGRLWFQPPYSNPLPGAERLALHREEGYPWMGLVKHDPSTQWWKAIVSSEVIVGMFPRRVRFEGDYAKGGTPNMTVTLLSERNPPHILKKHFPQIDWRASL